VIVIAQTENDNFEIDADPFYSEENLDYLRRKMTEYKSGELKFSEHGLLED